MEPKKITKAAPNIKKGKSLFSHSPTLDSILMVENKVKSHSGKYSKCQLWKSLPKGMMYQTFQAIFDYLEMSEKIRVNSEGKIVWSTGANFIAMRPGQDTIQSQHQGEGAII